MRIPDNLVWIISRQHVGFFQIIIYILFVIIGIWFHFLMFNFSNMISFWVDKADQILWIPEILAEISSRPASIYPKWIRCFLMWLLPILTSFNLPIDIIRGKVNMAGDHQPERQRREAVQRHGDPAVPVLGKRGHGRMLVGKHGDDALEIPSKIGRASCRERV